MNNFHCLFCPKTKFWSKETPPEEVDRTH